jgi:hypothetical protein
MDHGFAIALERGKLQGYLTYGQLNELLPDDMATEQIDQLLLLLEEAGIDLRDDIPTQPTAPVLLPRLHRVPAFTERLGRLGVACTDCGCYLDAEGNVQSAKIIVPGTEAKAVWRRLRQHWPESGLWPTIRVYRWGGAPRSNRVEQSLPPGSQWIDWVDTVSRARNARECIDKADRCGTDPRTFHRWHRGALETLTAAELDELCQRSPPTPVAANPDVFGAKSPFHFHLDAGTDQPPHCWPHAMPALST